MDDIKYLKEQTSALINLYNAKIFDEVVRKGKLLIKKFPNQILFYNFLTVAVVWRNRSLFDKYFSKIKRVHIRNSNYCRVTAGSKKWHSYWYDTQLLQKENF